MKNNHLALFREPYYGYIIEGKKPKELRISKNRNPPYHRIMTNDSVFMKAIGSDIIEYKFIVKNVEFFMFQIIPDDTADFLFKHRIDLCITSEFIQDKIGSKYATLITIGSLIKLKAPIHYHKQDQRSWIVGFQHNRLI